MRTIIESKSRGSLLVEMLDDNIKIMDSDFNEITLPETEVAQIKAVLTHELKVVTTHPV